MADDDTNKRLKEQFDKLDKKAQERVIKHRESAYASAKGRSEAQGETKLKKEKMILDYRRERDNKRMQERAARRNARASRSFRQGAPTVAGTLLGSMIGAVMLLAITVSCGPLIDYFQAWLMNQPGNPYVTPILDLFTWIYVFIFASWVVYLIVIYRAITSTINYGVYD